MCKILTIQELQEMKEDKEMSDFLDNFGNRDESNKFIDDLLENIKYIRACYKSNNKSHLYVVKWDNYYPRTLIAAASF